MKALLLAAGQGTRLGHLSRTTPKCLQRIGESTVLDRLVDQLSDAGVSEFLINTHHLAEQVHERVARAQWGARATVVYEPRLLGTLGTLRSNLDFFEDGPGWVLHADNFIEGTVEQLWSVYETKAAAVWGAMLTFRVLHPREFGVVTVDSQGLLSGFFEKVQEPPSDLASAATFVFGPEVLRLAGTLTEEATDISRDLMPLLNRRMAVVVHRSRIIDIGTPGGLAQANEAANSSC